MDSSVYRVYETVISLGWSCFSNHYDRLCYKRHTTYRHQTLSEDG